MTIRHHLNDDLLLDYAAGTLSEGWSLAVACHLAMCPQCREQLALAEATGGALMEELTPVEAPSDSWDALKSRLLAEPEAKAAPARRPATATLPEPLRSYLGGDLDGLWNCARVARPCTKRSRPCPRNRWTSSACPSSTKHPTAP